MTALLCSALFSTLDSLQLAETAHQLGYDGIHLVAGDQTPEQVAQTALVLAAEGLPVAVVSPPASDLTSLGPWLAVAAQLDAALLVDLPADASIPDLAGLVDASGARCLLAHRPGTAVPDPAALAERLADCPAPSLLGALAPDRVAREREVVAATQVARWPLPALGLVQVANYVWESKVEAGNERVWQPHSALLLHGVTPWAAWLQRLREAGYDGAFSFGDPALTANREERIRHSRDDLRVVRRSLHPGRPEDAAGTGEREPGSDEEGDG